MRDQLRVLLIGTSLLAWPWAIDVRAAVQEGLGMQDDSGETKFVPRDDANAAADLRSLRYQLSKLRDAGGNIDPLADYAKPPKQDRSIPTLPVPGSGGITTPDYRSPSTFGDNAAGGSRSGLGSATPELNLGQDNTSGESLQVDELDKSSKDAIEPGVNGGTGANGTSNSGTSGRDADAIDQDKLSPANPSTRPNNSARENAGSSGTRPNAGTLPPPEMPNIRNGSTANSRRSSPQPQRVVPASGTGAPIRTIVTPVPYYEYCTPRIVFDSCVQIDQKNQSSEFSTDLMAGNDSDRNETTETETHRVAKPEAYDQRFSAPAILASRTDYKPSSLFDTNIDLPLGTDPNPNVNESDRDSDLGSGSLEAALEPSNSGSTGQPASSFSEWSQLPRIVVSDGFVPSGTGYDISASSIPTLVDGSSVTYASATIPTSISVLNSGEYSANFQEIPYGSQGTPVIPMPSGPGLPYPPPATPGIYPNILPNQTYPAPIVPPAQPITPGVPPAGSGLVYPPVTTLPPTSPTYPVTPTPAPTIPAPIPTYPPIAGPVYVAPPPTYIQPQTPVVSTPIPSQTPLASPLAGNSIASAPTYLAEESTVVNHKPFVSGPPKQVDARRMVSPTLFRPAASTCNPCGTGQPGYAPPVGTVPGGSPMTYIPPTYMPYQPSTVPYAGYRSLVGFGQDMSRAQLGRGIVGQPTAYIPNQPVRNIFRYIFP